MPRVQWYAEGRVLYVRHPALLDNTGVITWNGIAADMMEPYRDIPHPIHVIIDATHVKDFDVDLAKVMQHEDVIRSTTHPRLGWAVYIGNRDNPLYIFMATIAGQRLGEDIKFFDTEAEAVDFLKRRDLSLSDLSVRNLSALP